MEKRDIESGHTGSEVNASIGMDDTCRRLRGIITAMCNNLGPPLSSNCCIYRVRKKRREINEAAYTPRIVSIGPFHNKKEGLSTMEKHKVRYLEKFIRRLPDERFNDLVIYIKKSEERVRSCYAETIELKDDDFLKMVLLDGCFIIELFLVDCYRNMEDDNDKMLKKFLLGSDIYVDLFLLENQLPFFLLEGLYNIAFPMTPSWHFSFLELSCHFFSYYNPQKIFPQVEEVKHFTDLLRSFHLSSSERCPPKYNKKFQLSKSASELQEAGVKFKVGSSKCLFDIQFKDGVLEIPFLKFGDRTESNFRNIMALEQCLYVENASFTSYILLMDSLIDTSKDVELLDQADIIQNWLGDNNQVANLVNSLTKEILLSSSSFHYGQLCEDMNEYCKVPWNSYKATCRREYFSTPWRIASTIAAFVLLFLTFVQAVTSIISLFVTFGHNRLIQKNWGQNRLQLNFGAKTA